MKHLLGLTTVALLATAACAPKAAPMDTTADVTGGKVSGAAQGGVTVFKGIPFAAPPLGKLRWAEPAPVVPWQGPRQATQYAAPCMQDSSMLQFMGVKGNASEDCLYLNVWTPAKTRGDKLPVMVWIYGGGFAGGATSSPLYDGSRLAGKGVIVVSLAYRLGALGFMASPELSQESGHGSGNYGLEDQIAGLKWVRDNIAQFGGDPANVTIFGESAGGIAVSMLAASPEAKGLFAKAISESGGNFGPARKGAEGGANMRNLADAEKQGADFLKALGAKDIAAARALPAEKIQAGPGAGAQGGFWPNFDGHVLPGDQYVLYNEGKFNDTPVLIGTNSNEGGLFVQGPVTPAQFENNVRAQYGASADALLAVYPHATPPEALQSSRDLFRETAFAWPTWAWARLQTEKGAHPAYVYYFDVRTPEQPDGSNHASEMPYVFGNIEVPAVGGSKPDKPTSDQMMSYWTNFAKTGDPNGDGVPEWPKFTLKDQQVRVLGTTPGVSPIPHRPMLEVWEDYYKKLRAAGP
jgi:para-nitrobenzyl esterase